MQPGVVGIVVTFLVSVGYMDALDKHCTVKVVLVDNSRFIN